MPTYVLGTFYIRFILYQCYDIPVSGEAHCMSYKQLASNLLATCWQPAGNWKKHGLAVVNESRFSFHFFVSAH